MISVGRTGECLRRGPPGYRRFRTHKGADGIRASKGLEASEAEARPLVLDPYLRNARGGCQTCELDQLRPRILRPGAYLARGISLSLERQPSLHHIAKVFRISKRVP